MWFRNFVVNNLEMEKLGLTEFSEVFYDNLDTVLTTSLLHLEENESFYDEVVFRMFDVYQRDNRDYSVNDLLLLFHIFLHAMFRYKPSVEKNDNELKIL